MADDLTVVASVAKGWSVLTAKGEIDVATVPALRAAVDQVATDRHPRVMFDLTGVTFLDSSGVSVLAGAIKTFGAQCVRVAGTKRIRDILRITGLAAAIGVFETAEEALKADLDVTKPGPD
jgi:anti-sigma B factor antagonist